MNRRRLEADYEAIVQILTAAVPEGEFWMVDVYEAENLVVVTLRRRNQAVENELRPYVVERRARLTVDPDVELRA